ncbi:hypothetical protein PIB30_039234 [Stylosanthes scabra]|uniref:Uncharacterized protein n=1 Tax=Stylosanthes scabra TaxID=79078 RepID=A0ABU6TG53_9FABA|nr:hypothetical protein [Stylosanthes scabra]
MEDFQVSIQLFLICLISTIAVRAVILTRNRNKSDHHPQNLPSPQSLPIIGHLHLISSLPHQSFHNLSTRYGPIFQIFLGSFPCVVVSTPEIAKEFLKTHESSFSNRFITLSMVDYITYGSKGIVFAPYGSHWKFIKKLCMSELLGQRTLDQHLLLRREETLRFVKALKKKGEAGETVDISGELITLTNNVISRMAMSIRCFEEGGDDGGLDDTTEIRKMVKDMIEFAGKLNNVSDFIGILKNWDLQGMNKRLKKTRGRFDSLMERVIREHKLVRKNRKVEGDEDGRVRDLLDILLEIHEDNKGTDEIQLTIEDIKAIIMDIFMAGTDTSATSMEWALAELINNPHVMKKARQEIDSLTAKNRLIQESDVANLPYLQAIVKETLRLHPVVPFFPRQSTETTIICGYEIPPKTSVLINLWSMGRDPKIWENPLEFRPERFLDEERQLLDLRGQNFQLLPFGTGRRMCPGASLALLTVPTNLGAMIQCFEWKVDGIVSMEEKPDSGLTLCRAHPLTCVPLPRLGQLSYLKEN